MRMSDKEFLKDGMKDLRIRMLRIEHEKDAMNNGYSVDEFTFRNVKNSFPALYNVIDLLINRIKELEWRCTMLERKNHAEMERLP